MGELLEIELRVVSREKKNRMKIKRKKKMTKKMEKKTKM
jgi:hypothetical protein